MIEALAYVIFGQEIPIEVGVERFDGTEQQASPLGLYTVLADDSLDVLDQSAMGPDSPALFDGRGSSSM
ncbi:MAG: hypothetical protein OXG47_05635 [bacterium]|nr:hypothetical protein [bacterium]